MTLCLPRFVVTIYSVLVAIEFLDGCEHCIIYESTFVLFEVNPESVSQGGDQPNHIPAPPLSAQDSLRRMVNILKVENKL